MSVLVGLDLSWLCPKNRIRYRCGSTKDPTQILSIYNFMGWAEPDSQNY